MKQPWFQVYGWIYRPVSRAGWVITIIDLLFCVHIILFIFSRAHSVSDAFYGFFPFVAPAFLLWVWIGSKTSE